MDHNAGEMSCCGCDLRAGESFRWMRTSEIVAISSPGNGDGAWRYFGPSHLDKSIFRGREQGRMAR